MFFTYIIKSLNNNSYYIGQTDNIENRLIYHNSGRNKSTKRYLPWIVVYKKIFETRVEAVKYESYLKSLKSRKALEKIIN
jgi:putative endonuclease